MIGAASFQLHLGDTREWLPTLERHSVHCVVTSPPYWKLRSYLDAGHSSKPLEMGSEDTLDQHLSMMAAVFRDVWRALHPSGTLWVNYGDAWAQQGRHATKEDYKENERRALRKQHYTGAYSCTEYQRSAGTSQGSGLAPMQLLMLPARIALALQDSGWLLRSEVIWHKPNGKPEPCRRRPTRGHETIYLLAKQSGYYYDGHAVTNPSGASLRTVWTINNQPTHEGHTATFPEELAERCILLGSSPTCCEACLTPHLPVYEEEQDLDWQRRCGGDANGQYAGQALKDYASTGAETPGAVKSRILRGMVKRKLLRHEPACACGGKPIPTTILDPFGGTATTGVVALRHGRRFVGCELSPEYHKIGLDRLEAARKHISVQEERSGQLSLLEAL